jgi:hypothetical protein
LLLKELVQVVELGAQNVPVVVPGFGLKKVFV